jgi:hypothetical protein
MTDCRRPYLMPARPRVAYSAAVQAVGQDLAAAVSHRDGSGLIVDAVVVVDPADRAGLPALAATLGRYGLRRAALVGTLPPHLVQDLRAAGVTLAPAACCSPALPCRASLPPGMPRALEPLAAAAAAC